jgi:hypothetical protein
VIPALIAHRNDDPAELAHAVGDYSDRAFCGQWTVEHTSRHWPVERDEWHEAHPRCPLCEVLVYS